MSSEKTEEPTEQKLEKAREKGQVAKSADLVHALALLGTLAAMLLFAGSIWERFDALVRSSLNFGDGDISLMELYQRAGSMAMNLLWIVLPLLAAAAMFSIVGLLMQVGFFLSPKALEPNFDKLNPVNGIKNVFSKKSLLTFVQMLLKAVILGLALWESVLALMPFLAAAAHQTVTAIGLLAWLSLQKLLAVALLLFLAFGPVDFIIQRWQFLKDQRMTKDEVKREYKDAEGDPIIKSERTHLGRELVDSAPNKGVENANAVIVNPTHYAVAISYQRGNNALPVVVAKGMDEAAMEIRRRAEIAGVPIISNPPLARALFKIQTNAHIPTELFESVAAVLLWVEGVGAQNNSGYRT